MTTLSTMIRVFQDLAEAGRELAAINALREQFGADAHWARQMDMTAARMARAVAAYDEWQNLEREWERQKYLASKAGDTNTP